MLALTILPGRAAFAQAVGDDHDTSFNPMPPGSDQSAPQQDLPRILPDPGSAARKSFEKKVRRLLAALRKFKKELPTAWKQILEEFIKNNSEV